MAIELRQQLKLTQQLIMTPQLQMAIKLLQLSRLELVDAIQQELEENPTLEEIQETPDSSKDRANPKKRLRRCRRRSSRSHHR
jgi:RNA polymerase sigma-54 factor